MQESPRDGRGFLLVEDYGLSWYGEHIQCDRGWQLLSARKPGNKHTCVLTVTRAALETLGYCSLSLGWPGLTAGQGEVQASPRVLVTRLERGGEGRSASRDGLVTPFPPLPPGSSICFLPKLRWALRHRNKGHFPPSYCHLLGFHTFRGSGGREPLPFSQCLCCAPAAPPGPGILFAAWL